MSQTFAELRSLLQQPPSQETWRRLCELLDAHPADGVLTDELIPYAASFLKRWPTPMLATARPAWIESLIEGQPNPRLALALHLELRVSGLFGRADRALEQLARSPHLQNLQSLNLEHLRISAPNAHLLAHDAQLPALRRLTLGGNLIEQEGMPALFSAPWLRQLTHLILRYGTLSPPLATKLLRGLDGGPLEVLSLSCRETPASLPLEMRHTTLPSTLHMLSLDSADLFVDGALALSELPFTRLHTLSLNGCRVGDSGMAALVEAPWLSGVRALNLSYNNLTARGVHPLAQHPAAAGLRTLSMYGNHINDDGAIAIAQSPHLSQLDELRMELNDITHRGGQALATSQTLPEHLRAQWRALYP